MKWLRILLGYKYKIVWMQTDFRASEFQHTIMAKVSINNPIQPKDLEAGVKATWMWAWDWSSFRCLYTKSKTGAGKIISMRGTNIYYNRAEIKKLFEKIR